MFVVAGIRADGYREILRARIADGEHALLWEGYFDELKARGLHGVRMVISDGHRGIIQAVQHSFPNASWQLCHVHFMRNLLKTMAKKHYLYQIVGRGAGETMCRLISVNDVTDQTLQPSYSGFTGNHGLYVSPESFPCKACRS
ncbi:MAG: transposase [Thermoplasmata archaeon]|uniref:Transposase n=1 Tax=Candidatus Sysuiplasma superficiale TaxID=2823368 RepID=A0A8J7YQS2_9ARCH|nr:transposase [Candidatus Sysuiplasma superficiale]